MAYTHKAHAVIVDFGRRVRAVRLAAGLSQQALGRRARVGRRFIGLIERGAANPSLETMVLVADALGCTITDLFSREKNPSQYIVLSDDNLRRVHEAIGVLGSVLKVRKRARRASKR